MDINSIALIIATTLMYATPLIFAAMGSILSERCGIVNIGIEGLMVVGAFFGAMCAVETHNPWLAFFLAGMAGTAFATLHAIACISCNADQTVSGIALNFLAPGFSLFLCKYMYNGSSMTTPISLDEKIPRLSFFPQSTPLATVFNTYATVYIAVLAIIIVYFVLYKTKLGLRIRACGEHPKAADTLGVNVTLIRYGCVAMSGFLAALGGASMSIAIVSAYRPSIISGQGFIAIAAVIFGKYHPMGAAKAALLFGFCQGLIIYLGGPSLGLNIPSQLLSMTPYIITIVVMVLFVGKSQAPAASGKPYSKS